MQLIHYKRKEEDVDPQCKTTGIIFNRKEVEMSAEARQEKRLKKRMSLFFLKLFFYFPNGSQTRHRFGNQPDQGFAKENHHESVTLLASAAMNRTKAAEIAKDMGDQSRYIEILKTAAESWGTLKEW